MAIALGELLSAAPEQEQEKKVTDKSVGWLKCPKEQDSGWTRCDVKQHKRLTVRLEAGTMLIGSDLPDRHSNGESLMIDRRQFLAAGAGVTLGSWCLPSRFTSVSRGGIHVSQVRPEEDVFSYLRRTQGSFDAAAYRGLLGAANEFKEGDEIVGVAALDQASRDNARRLLTRTRVRDIDDHPLHQDRLHQLATAARTPIDEETAAWTLGQLRDFLLTETEAAIKAKMTALSSEVIGCVVKVMTNAELIVLGSKVFNPLPGSRIGARGYLGARIQPNSPTDNVDDIFWQVLDGWSYAVGDVVLGTNPVSSDPVAVAAVQRTLRDLLETFELEDVLPHCVLSHIDVQAEVEQRDPGSTALWFQSIAGTDAANGTFDITLEKMLNYADTRRGRYGLYFETGQGADFTNGHGHGFDMLLHEARKYGFARALSGRVAAALRSEGRQQDPWVHLNDVAGFIGPEVFRTREQLVRCCLEDIAMGKLHGLCIGLDVCATLHMDISLDDLDWCLEQVMPANPAYLMALPTKIDPMLGYLTTSFQDHLRLRELFRYKVDDRVWRFFQVLGVIDSNGRPTAHFGDPLWVFLQYCRRQGDTRAEEEVLAEGRARLAAVRGRGVFIAAGHGRETWQLEPALEQQTRHICVDAKRSIWSELTEPFIAGIPRQQRTKTASADRADYILHPHTGEQLPASARRDLAALREAQGGRSDVQVVISDGLNAEAIMDDGHLHPYLSELRSLLRSNGYRPADEHIVVIHGRVRAGYRIGEQLFANQSGPRAVLHIIGERPGTGHHTFSIYITAQPGEDWARADFADHNLTKVVSGVAVTALDPKRAAADTVKILRALM